QPQGHLLVLLEGPAGRLQLLRLGRLLPRRQAAAGEARLACVRRTHRRPGDALSSGIELEEADRRLRIALQRQRPDPARTRIDSGEPGPANGRRPPEADAGALRRRLSTRPAAEVSGGALGRDPLDVDPDLAPGRDGDQGQLVAVAEVEPDLRVDGEAGLA